MSAARSVARSASDEATTELAGLPAAISRARFGPDRTARRRPGSSSSITSLMRRWLPSSIPLTADRIAASGYSAGARRRRTDRTCADGTATMKSRNGSSKNPSSVATRTFGGRTWPGRYRTFSRREASSSFASTECAQSVTGRSPSARRMARVVPHAPAPRTPTWSVIGRAYRRTQPCRRSRGEGFGRRRPAVPVAPDGVRPARRGRADRRAAASLMRSRKISRIGVPRNPYSARIRFSR